MQDPQNPDQTPKPRSPKQIAASRANGAKSTGPTTPEGHLKCSIAAQSQFKHNMLADTVLLTGESRERFTSLLQRYIDAFQPMTEPEHNVIQKMVVAYWHHLRSWSLHQTGFNCEIARQDAALPHPIRAVAAEHARNQANASRASHDQSTLDRLFRNAMRDLLLLRKLRGATAGLDTIPIPVASSVWEHPEEPRQE